jgi:hypothetical protein
MSEEQLVGLIREQLNEDSDFSSRRGRQFNTAKQGNNLFADNIGRAVYQYLDTVYLERIQKYIEETYEERIKKLEERVKSLEARVK